MIICWKELLMGGDMDKLLKQVILFMKTFRLDFLWELNPKITLCRLLQLILQGSKLVPKHN